MVTPIRMHGEYCEYGGNYFLRRSCIIFSQEGLRKKPQLSTSVHGLFENVDYGFIPPQKLLTYRVRKKFYVQLNSHTKLYITNNNRFINIAAYLTMQISDGLFNS